MMAASSRRLLDFLDQLEGAHVAYDLKHVRDSLMVVVAVPQGDCEIGFFPDGSIEVEWFRRDEGANPVEAAWLDTFIAEQHD